MYKIKLKGRDEPIIIKDDTGKMLRERWIENKLPARLVTENMAFLSTDIKSIEKIQRTEAEAPRDNSQNDAEYLAFRKKMLDLPIEARANIMRIPNLIWAAHTRKVMPEDVKEEIKARQLKYLAENPNCMYANPKVYRDLIPKAVTHLTIDEMNPIQNVVAAATLRLVQNIIQNDLLDSSRIRFGG